jgi:hypothetical protein
VIFAVRTDPASTSPEEELGQSHTVHALTADNAS